MYLCYMDESGTSNIPGNTSHFVLTGISIPIKYWKSCDRTIRTIKRRYDLEDAEIHLGWILRPYFEQNHVKNFENLDYSQRRTNVLQLRNAELLRLQRVKNPKLYRQTKKNYRKTEAYIHLTYGERKEFIKTVATKVSNWGFARIFAECVNKIFFDPSKTNTTIDKQSFEQIVTRFEHYLQIISNNNKSEWCCGLLIHDNNETVAKKHTDLMKQFYQKGTAWTSVQNIIETPLFVDSQLTSMVQIADLCAYSLRRYLENNEDELFDLIFKRADKHKGVVVGIRHFSDPSCKCKICTSHVKNSIT